MTELPVLDNAKRPVVLGRAVWADLKVCSYICASVDYVR